MDMEPLALEIEEMPKRHPGLSEPVAKCLYEAAQVCLSRHHESPATFRLEHGDDVVSGVLEWDVPTPRSRLAWANQDEATENGASALVLAAVEEWLGLVAFSRAETRSGADYYLVPLGSATTDLESSTRLEISGVDRGPVRLVYQRLRKKIEQVLRGRGALPALVGVAGFGSRRIVLETVEGEQ